MWDYVEGKELFSINVDHKIVKAIPSQTTEGVIYIVANQRHIYEIYIGLSPRNKSDFLSMLGKEGEANFSTSFEDGKRAHLGTGLFDKNGEEIFKTNEEPENKLNDEINNRRLLADVFPAVITNTNSGKTQVFMEQHHLFSAKRQVKFLLANRKYLFYGSTNTINCIDCETKQEFFGVEYVSDIL